MNQRKLPSVLDSHTDKKQKNKTNKATFTVAQSTVSCIPEILFGRITSKVVDKIKMTTISLQVKCHSA